MEPEDLEDRLRRHEAMMEGLAKVWMRQSEINERLDAFIEEQRGMNERMEGSLERMTHDAKKWRDPPWNAT